MSEPAEPTDGLPPTTSTPPPVLPERPPYLDDALIKRIEQRIKQNQQRLSSAPSAATSNPSTSTDPASRPPRNPPEYLAALGNLTMPLYWNLDDSPHWNLTVKGGRSLEAMYFLQHILARLEVFTSHVRLIAGRTSQLNELKDAKPALTTCCTMSPADAWASLTRFAGHETVERFASDVYSAGLDRWLMNKAEHAVAAEIYEERLSEYERNVPDTDHFALEQVDDSLTHFLRLRTAECKDRETLFSQATDNYLRITAKGVIRDTRGTDAFQRLLKKVCIAVFAGVTLLGPMLVMVLHPSLLTVLATTSISVIVVAVLLAIVMTEAEPKDVVGATAAYAAVLVVFVGTSGGIEERTKMLLEIVLVVEATQAMNRVQARCSPEVRLAVLCLAVSQARSCFSLDSCLGGHSSPCISQDRCIYHIPEAKNREHE